MLSVSRATRVFPRLASTSQKSLVVPGSTLIETSSGVKACLLESKVSDNQLSQHLKKNIADVSLVVKAGTRYELDSEHQLGLAQALKTFSLLSHQGSTMLRSTGTIETMGAEYEITVTRELMIYKISCQKDYLSDVLPFVTSALKQPEFRKWELSNVKYQAKLDNFLFSQNRVAVVVDLLHTAAFRKGLGNPLGTTEEQVDALTTNKMLEYHKKLFTGNNAYLVCNNTPAQLVQDNFTQFGSHVSSSSSNSAPSQFVSDEIRSDDNTQDDVVFAIASKSGPTNSKEAIVNSVLAHLLQGKSDHALGQKDFLNLVLDEDNSEWVKGFHCDYSDAGLFGFLVYCQSENAGKITKNLMNSLKSLEGSLTDDHVTVAKSSYYRSLLTQLATPSAQIEHMAAHMILGTAVSHEEFNSILQSVNKSDLKKALTSFINGPRSLAAHGNCSTVPYLEQI